MYTGLHRSLYLMCTEFTCRCPAGHSVRDCHEELAGRVVLINAAVPCILRAQFLLWGDG